MSKWIDVNVDLPVEDTIVIVLMNNGENDYGLNFARLDDYERGSWSMGFFDSQGYPHFTPIYTSEVLYWREVDWDGLYGLLQSMVNKILGLLDKETILGLLSKETISDADK